MLKECLKLEFFFHKTFCYSDCSYWIGHNTPKIASEKKCLKIKLLKKKNVQKLNYLNKECLKIKLLKRDV